MSKGPGEPCYVGKFSFSAIYSACKIVITPYSNKWNVDQYMNKTSCMYYILWLDPNEINDNIQATPILKGGKFPQLFDPNLGIEYDDGQMKRMVLAASLCIRREPRLRPQINLVSLLPLQRRSIPFFLLLPFE